MKTSILVASALLLSTNALAQVPSAPPDATPPIATTPPDTPPPTTTPPVAPGTPPSRSAPAPTPVAPPPFEALDANADGRISSTEAQANRALSAKFAVIDKQGKGYISKDEYQIFVQSERRGS